MINKDNNKILHLICKGKGNFSGVPTDLNGVERYRYQDYSIRSLAKLEMSSLEWDGKTYQSGYWNFTLEEATKLIGGNIFLHHTKKQPSTVGGNVKDCYQQELTEDNLLELGIDYIELPKRRNRVVFVFESLGTCKDVAWRGNDWLMSYNGGIISDISI